MKSSDYWKKRAEETLMAAERQGNDLIEELQHFYAEAEQQILREVEAFYGRYARNNKITVDEARKMLTSPQLLTFHEELERYYAEAERVGLGDDYKAYLRRLSGRGYISRQEELLAQIRHQVELLANRELEAFMDTLSEVYHEGFYRSIFDVQQGLGYGADFNRLDAAQVEKIVKRPWLGGSFSDRIWTHKADLLAHLDQMIPRAFAIGENSQVIGRQLAKRMGTAEYNGVRLVRTEVNHAAGEATKAAYSELGVERYQFLATLDNRTSDVCTALDGKVFRLSDAQAGVNYNPMHPNCRSTTVPYFEPDEFDLPSTRVARDDKGRRYTVPATMTYSQWYKERVQKRDN